MGNEISGVKMGTMQETWHGVSGMPKTITFCVTEDCNLACKYCYMTGKNHLKKMSFETAKESVDYILGHREIFNEECVIWDFIGGEPFLEMELIDKITDYIKLQMFVLDHPWFNSHRFSFSTNGLLYDTPIVQRYIQKNHHHISMGISVDGNKEKHDLQRVRLDGSGSYDDVVKNVPLWMKQFPGMSTKATFAHADLPYLKDSIINLWNIGIPMVSANVVFEDVWEEGDDLILEEQLKALGDYVIENKIWDKYSVRFFSPHIGRPYEKEDFKKNFCGAGKMLAIDCDGNFTPCVRFIGISLNKRKPIFIGNAKVGIDEDKIRPFLALNMQSQSTKECINCDVATGCAWCQGCNYDMAESDTIYQRATYLCKMHKATVRANKYFWDKFEKVTGLPSERRKIDEAQLKYLQFITSDQITPHCSYHNDKGTSAVMSPEILRKGIAFCKENHYKIAFLGVPEGLDQAEYEDEVIIDAVGKPNITLPIYKVGEEIKCVPDNSILLVNKGNLGKLFTTASQLLGQSYRVNIVVEDGIQWNSDDIENYKHQLGQIAHLIMEKYEQGEKVEVNVLTDIWDLKEIRTCGAGIKNFALAPNGRIYICPGFYFDNPDDYVGTLETGIEVKNQQLLTVDHAPICHACDVYNCYKCSFQSKKRTNEVNTPSKNQCLISHVEREISMKLQQYLKEQGDYTFVNTLAAIDYSDPLDKILIENER